MCGSRAQQTQSRAIRICIAAPAETPEESGQFAPANCMAGFSLTPIQKIKEDLCRFNGSWSWSIEEVIPVDDVNLVVAHCSKDRPFSILLLGFVLGYSGGTATDLHRLPYSSD